ncbi:MAG TPA: hypothetical protein PLS94_00355 [Prolixibacteraceae bacterium]|nr:hypothetical protein [Prolixibacteraceae bacterium]HPR61137.1 hypothetical protein [Prolixibacteraceae bacterium]
MRNNTVNTHEKKLYKVLRNVGVKPKYIKKAESLDDLYLDEYDHKLLVHYFENEFELNLKNNDINKLTNLDAFRAFIDSK